MVSPEKDECWIDEMFHISHNHISKCPCSLMFSSYFYPKQHVLVTTQKRKQNFWACPQLAKLETRCSGALKLAPQRKCRHPMGVYICCCLACNQNNGNLIQ